MASCWRRARRSPCSATTTRRSKTASRGCRSRSSRRPRPATRSRSGRRPTCRRPTRRRRRPVCRPVDCRIRSGCWRSAAVAHDGAARGDRHLRRMSVTDLGALRATDPPERSMRPTLRALCAVAWLLLLGGAAAPQTKSTPAEIAAAMAKDPMLFYLAKGEADACGPGCSEWIAAEGHIDMGAPYRLRTLLAGLGKRKLPIFFHSPGGLSAQGMEIGRLLRQREMTTGVAMTVPAGCAAASEESCRALKRSGKPLAADLSSLGTCNSACVTALIGGKVRHVPPGARVGVHSAKPIQLQSNGVVKAVLQGKVSPQSVAQMRRYHQEMQIAAELFDLGA